MKTETNLKLGSSFFHGIFMHCGIPIAFNVSSFLVNFCTTTTTTKIMCRLCKGFFWIFLQKLPFFEEKHFEVTTFRS